MFTFTVCFTKADRMAVHRNQIGAAFIFARSNFVNVS